MKKEKHHGCEPCVDSDYDRKMYISISEAENGWTVSSRGNDYVAASKDEALEIVETLLEMHEKLKKDKKEE